MHKSLTAFCGLVLTVCFGISLLACSRDGQTPDPSPGDSHQEFSTTPNSTEPQYPQIGSDGQPATVMICSIGDDESWAFHDNMPGRFKPEFDLYGPNLPSQSGQFVIRPSNLSPLIQAPSGVASVDWLCTNDEIPQTKQFQMPQAILNPFVISTYQENLYIRWFRYHQFTVTAEYWARDRNEFHETHFLVAHLLSIGPLSVRRINVIGKHLAIVIKDENIGAVLPFEAITVDSEDGTRTNGKFSFIEDSHNAAYIVDASPNMSLEIRTQDFQRLNVDLYSTP